MSTLPTHTPLLRPVWLVLIALLTSACTRCGSPQKNLHAAAEPAAPAAEQCIESVVTGDGTICVLRTDGSVLCFGRLKDFTDAGPSGKVMVVPALRSISEDGHGFCGVTRTGEVVTWAVNEERAKVLDVFGKDNLTVVSVTGGYCVLKESHEVRCQSRYNPVPPEEAPLLHTQASKLYNQIVITDGGVEVWGKNQSGWLGTAVPTSDSTSHPATLVQHLPGPVAKVAISTGAICALNARGEAWCWGDGSSGGLGQGREQPHFCAKKTCPELIHQKPVRVSLPEPVQDLAGPSAICALLAGGSVWCWGWNFEGLVKTPATITHRANGLAYEIEPNPQKNASFGTDNVRIFGDLKNLCALKVDGSLWCAGDNRSSQIPAEPIDGKWPEYVPATRMNVSCD